MGSAYTVAKDNATPVNGGPGGNEVHFCGVKPGASVGLVLIDWYAEAIVGNSELRRAWLHRITPTAPVVTQTAEKGNAHSPAAAAETIIDSESFFAGAYTEIGNPVVLLGSSWTDTTRMNNRGWTTPRARSPIVLQAGAATHLVIVLGANSLASAPSASTWLTFAEPEPAALVNRSRYRRTGQRSGEYQSKSSRCGMNGVAGGPHHVGQFSYVADHAYLQAEDWPEPVRDPAAQLNLLLAATTSQTIAVGQVTETDTAQAIAWAPKRRFVNQVTETDLAQPITRRKTAAVGQVVETDLAQPIARLKTKLVSQASETDLAQAIVRSGITVPVGQVIETDVAQPIAVNPIRRLVGQVTETDVARAITPVLSGAGNEIMVVIANTPGATEAQVLTEHPTTKKVVTDSPNKVVVVQDPAATPIKVVT